MPFEHGAHRSSKRSTRRSASMTAVTRSRKASVLLGRELRNAGTARSIAASAAVAGMEATAGATRFAAASSPASPASACPASRIPTSVKAAGRRSRLGHPWVPGTRRRHAPESMRRSPRHERRTADRARRCARSPVRLRGGGWIAREPWCRLARDRSDARRRRHGTRCGGDAGLAERRRVDSFDAGDPFADRRMRGEERRERRGEEEVAELRDVRVPRGARRQSADLRTRRRDAVGFRVNWTALASARNSRWPADRGLDEPSEERAERAGGVEQQAEGHDAESHRTAVVRVRPASCASIGRCSEGTSTRRVRSRVSRRSRRSGGCSGACRR